MSTERHLKGRSWDQLIQLGLAALDWLQEREPADGWCPQGWDFDNNAFRRVLDAADSCLDGPRLSYRRCEVCGEAIAPEVRDGLGARQRDAFGKLDDYAPPELCRFAEFHRQEGFIAPTTTGEAGRLAAGNPHYDRAPSEAA